TWRGSCPRPGPAPTPGRPPCVRPSSPSCPPSVTLLVAFYPAGADSSLPVAAFLLYDPGTGLAVARPIPGGPHGQEAVPRQPELRDHRRRPGGDVRRPRHGAVRTGHHGPRDGPLQGVRL